MELFRSLGALLEAPREELRPAVQALELGDLPTSADHSALFLFRLYPYASVYLGPEGKLGGEARDRVAGFWRALDASPPTEPDHLTVLLATYAELCERDADSGNHNRLDNERVGDSDSPWRRARSAFLWEHLLSWLPLYLQALKRADTNELYHRWADLLWNALEHETSALQLPETLPLCLREDPGLTDPREHGLAPFLDALLAPARTGFILTADHLRNGASQLGLGVRVGERLFVLKGLFSQDAQGTLGYLRGLAESPLSSPWPAISEVWNRRRAQSAQLLAELEQDAAVLNF